MNCRNCCKKKARTIVTEGRTILVDDSIEPIHPSEDSPCPVVGTFHQQLTITIDAPPPLQEIPPNSVGETEDLLILTVNESAEQEISRHDTELKATVVPEDTTRAVVDQATPQITTDLAESPASEGEKSEIYRSAISETWRKDRPNIRETGFRPSTVPSSRPEEPIIIRKSTADKIRESDRGFFLTWMRMLELWLHDVLAWDKEEALIRSHVLLRLLVRELNCTSGVFVGAADMSALHLEHLQQARTGSGILDLGAEAALLRSPPGRENDKLGVTSLVVNLIPISHEIALDSVSLRERLVDVFEASEIDDLRLRLTGILNTIATARWVQNLREKWHHFSHLMAQFGLGSRVRTSLFPNSDQLNFDIDIRNLMTNKSVIEWLNLIHEYEKSSLPIAAAVDPTTNAAAAVDPMTNANSSEENTTQIILFFEALITILDAHHPEAERQETLIPSDDEIETSTRRSTKVKLRETILKSISKIRHPGLRYQRESSGEQPQTTDVARSPSVLRQQSEKNWLEDRKKGVVLAYRMTSEGTVAVKVRAKLKIPFVKAMISLDDIAGYTRWIPYCVKSEKLATFSSTTHLLSLISDMPWPVKKRETLGYCGCVEALYESGEVVVFLTTLGEHLQKVLDFSVPAANPKIPRIKLSNIGFFVKPLDVSKIALEIRAIMDTGVNSKFLRALIPWLVKNSVLDFFGRIAKIANVVNFEEVKKSNHPNLAFYESMERRVMSYLVEKRRASVDLIPRSPKNMRKIDKFEEADVHWHRRLSTFKLD